jgi:multiple sugar transport system permease protein/raffinose/stachyose/melibiose transport system permease protein
MIFSPAIIAPIIVGIIWWFIFDPQIGFLNALLTQLGNENWRIMWIGDGTFAPYSIAFIYFWQQLGFITTIFFAGLRMIPYELYEAAAIDGASRAKKVWHITIPMLKETIQIVVVLIITGCFKVFEIVLQLTNGGPNHLSEVLVTYTYLTTFKAGQYGYGMSMAVATFLIAILLSISYILIPKGRKNVEGDM